VLGGGANGVDEYSERVASESEYSVEHRALDLPYVYSRIGKALQMAAKLTYDE